jgi:hypothetical protein
MSVAGDLPNNSPDHLDHPGPLFLATAGGRITGALELAGSAVALMPNPPFAADFSGLGRSNGDPPRILIGKTADRVWIDTSEGRLRTAGANQVRWSATGAAVNGNAPVAKAAAIASPAGGATVDAEARGAIDAIRVAIAAFGITA